MPLSAALEDGRERESGVGRARPTEAHLDISWCKPREVRIGRGPLGLMLDRPRSHGNPLA
jgi:hypothetical protein